MKKKFISNKKNILIGIIVLSSFVTLFVNSFYSKKIEENFQRSEVVKIQNQIRTTLTKHILDGNTYPDFVNINERRFQIFYTLNQDLQLYVERLLKQFKSEYASIVVIDNNTGEIIAATGFNRETNSFDLGLVYSSAHPSASLFKIVTSANLLEDAGYNRNTIVSYSGKATTLYKYQLKENQNKWTRFQSLGKAFAVSNNVVFAKAALKNLNSTGLMNKANNFGFNHALMMDLELGQSKLMAPEEQYQMAELASGFNVETTISPIHAALLSSIVANDGVIKFPRIIAAVKDTASGELIKFLEKNDKRAMNINSANELESLMQETIIQGTAKSSFKKLSSFVKNNVRIGGKTGSITGGDPWGKRDWFTAFAIPNSGQLGSGISVCVMNVNVKKWYVKSTFLAKNVIEYYYQKANKDYGWPHNQSLKKNKNEIAKGS